MHYVQFVVEVPESLELDNVPIVEIMFVENIEKTVYVLDMKIL